MENNLRRISQDLRAYAKRTKNFRYSDSALITFLITGMIFIAGNIFAAPSSTDASIQNQMNQLNTSISQMRKDFRRARQENQKLIKNTNLELFQLTEQGDHVTKSPWSSWQFGMNYFYNDWHGTFKGRGNKVDNIIYQRDQTLNRYIARPVNEGSANNTTILGFAYEPNAAIPISASITPKSITKTNPNIQKNVAIASLPSFEPRTVNEPSSPIVTAPTPSQPASFDVNVISYGNGQDQSIDNSSSGNAIIEGVAVTSGNFYITASAGSGSQSFSYWYTGYSGQNAWGGSKTSNNPNISSSNYNNIFTAGSGGTVTYSSPTLTINGENVTWSNLDRGSSNSQTTVTKNGFQKVYSNAMLTNSTNIMSRNVANSTYLLREFVHLDMHGVTAIGTQRAGFVRAVGSLSSDLQTKVLTAYDDAITYANGTKNGNAAPSVVNNPGTTSGTVTTAGGSAKTWLNSGKIYLEGGNLSLTNSYEHLGNVPTGRAIVINTGDVVIQPYLDRSVANPTVSDVRDSYNAVFVLSRDVYTYANSSTSTDPAYVKQQTIYNSGNIKTYTKSTALYLLDPMAPRKMNIVNKGVMETYGENSTGIFVKDDVHMSLNFSNMEANVTNATTDDYTQYQLPSGATSVEYNPIVMYGDKSTGLYVSNNLGTATEYSLPRDRNAQNTVVTGYFAVDIGNVAGLGNQNFTTDPSMTQGQTLTNYDINTSQDSATATDDENNLITGSSGIYSFAPINLQGHQIRIYDNTKGNVGVYPGGAVAVSLGEGEILLKDGINNTGIVTQVAGSSVTSAGTVTLSGGTGNMAIYNDGKSNNSTSITVKNVDTTGQTTNSVAAYSKAAGQVDVKEKFVVNTKVVSTAESADPAGTNKSTENAGGVYATGSNTVVRLASDITTVSPAPTSELVNIKVTGAAILNSDGEETGEYAGFGLFAEDGARISTSANALATDGAKIEVTGGSVALAAVGANSDVTVDKGTVTYDGKGYALYSRNNGTVNLTNGELILKGEATGFSVDASIAPASQPIKLTGSTVDMQSDNAILMSVKNATNLKTTGIAATLLSYSGLNPADVSSSNNSNYKIAVLDGAKIDIDGTGIDKSDSTTGSDSEVFTRRLIIQNSVLDVNSTVSAHLNSTQITDIDSKLTVPVGLSISASGNSSNRNTTGVNVANGATVTVDRTDGGNGGVGVYVNYGTVTNDGTIEVEKTTPNDYAVGVYATNGTKVENQANGTIDVGGKDSIGILGLSYRIDSKGNVVYEKFDTGGAVADNIGIVDITNKGKITLDGENALGIYTKNNSLDATGTNSGYARVPVLSNSYTKSVNDGEITMTGKNSIGMITEGGALTNDTTGKITINGQEGVAMYGTYATGAAMTAPIDRLNAELVNKGTLELADTTGTTPIIGMFTNDADTTIATSGTINIGKKSYGIYGASNNVYMTDGTINVGEDGVGIFATGSSDNRIFTDSEVYLQGGTINVGNNEAVGVFIADNAANPIRTVVENTGTNMTVGTNSFGYVVDSTTGTNLLLGANSLGTINKLTASLGTDSVYAYSNDKNGAVYSYTDITTAGGKSYGLYTAGRTENYGTIDLRGGNGNVGIYSTGASPAGIGAINHGTIIVGGTDLVAKEYGIGMATGYYNETTGAISNEGIIENRGTINVSNDNSIGMYAVGAGSKAINYNTIDISGKNATGMYIDQGAEGINYGTITSTGTASGIKGVATVNGGYIKNYGTITITSPGGIGIYQDAASALTQKNDATASGVNPLTLASQTGTASGTKAAVYSATSTDEKYIVTPKGRLLIQNPPRAPRLTINDREVTLTGVDTNVASPAPAYVTAGSTTLDLSLPLFANTVSNAQVTEVGMYVDTSGVNYTNPIQGLRNLVGLENINLIIGTEAAKYTDAKAIEIGENILKPYNDAISSLTTTGTTLNINSAGLTWLAQPLQGTNKPIETLYMIKIPYTFFASAKDENTYNFLDGLEQRYGVEALGSRERQIFDKLNGLGKAETHIFTQAVDEMKGHQYANVQQRVNATGNTLDKEFRYLRDEWRNPSKQNNKIKVFGARDEYSTDTAGIINYRSNAYGVAYVHEDEKIQMGSSSGWYAGAVTNRFKFKDIGHSREDQTMAKIGIFKTMSPKWDHNGALQWTVSGDVFAGINNMKRRFWIIDDVFEAKSTYNSYGAAIKNELGYDIRMSERTHLKPYGALKLEYGRFNKINEKSAQMRLEVEGNDYFSVKPEVGMEFKYVQPLAVRTNLSVGLTAAYENELGKLQSRNRARVGYTTADWYNLEKEKEDRKGNGKFDLNIGIDNTRFGVTVNAGYDTKGDNVRGGIGFRAIY